jgi:glyceraldehyde-3-phosphate dehydrogenase/erythrose-4-phosphate dehydrogenase
MKTRIAINGFGRIGRNAFKIAFARDDIEIVAINDLTDTKTLAYLLKHDSNYGTYDQEVGHDDENVIVAGHKVKVLAVKDPLELPWKDMDIDVVIESTGFFTDKEGAGPREGRNAAENIVPTSTGAAIAVTLTLPQLKDKFDGLSIRVPTPVVSLSDVTALLKRNTTVEEINEVFKKAAKEPFYQGILGVSDEPLVSSDYIGNSHSGTVDLALTKVVAGNLVKVMVWYDNEWGYSNRLVEVVADTGKFLHKS